MLFLLELMEDRTVAYAVLGAAFWHFAGSSMWHNLLAHPLVGHIYAYAVYYYDLAAALV